MDRIRVIDLAEVMIKKIAPLYGYNPKNIQIKIIGIRAGEKMNEELITEEERKCLIDLGELYVLPKPRVMFQHKDRKNGTIPKPYNGKIHEGKLLSIEDIHRLLEKIDIDNPENSLRIIPEAV